MRVRVSQDSNVPEVGELYVLLRHQLCELSVSQPVTQLDQLL
jgi:hypothetical protein